MQNLTLLAAIAATLAAAGGATAQTYPSRPITMVVAFAAGGIQKAWKLRSDQRRRFTRRDGGNCWRFELVAKPVRHVGNLCNHR